MSRLRVIAGPNGSGKSSVFQLIKEFKEQEKIIQTGPFVNSDLIEKDFRENGRIILRDFGITAPTSSIVDDYLKISTLKDPYDPKFIKDQVVLVDNQLKFVGDKPSALIGMVISDLIREELLRLKVPFTMETVFSHADKVRFMQRAKDAGYKVYLYFVSTESAEINVNRVAGRVAEGGHDVPTQKIVERYKRTMENLYDAVMISYRAYIFDNSGPSTIKIAEKNKNGEITFGQSVPEWVLQYLHLNS